MSHRVDRPFGRAQYPRMKVGFGALASALLAISAHAQPSEEDARLKAAEMAAVAAICAYVRAGDPLSEMCGLGPARARTAAQFAAEAATRPRPKPNPNNGSQILIAPPGFGPDPTAPLE